MTNKSLIIVESPGKISKIKQIVGPSFYVMASMGHLMDLPKLTIGIDMKTYEPTYETYTDKIKKKIIKNLKQTHKLVNFIYIATDDDREGEFIAYSIIKILKLKERQYRRIIFHEITEQAIKNALITTQCRTTIDNNIVDAQQCRRIIDRLIGYTISPELKRNKEINNLLKHNSSVGTGRVQAVIIKIIYDKMEEREKKEEKDKIYNCNAYFKCGEMELNTDINICNVQLKGTKNKIINWYKFIETHINATYDNFYIDEIDIKYSKHNPPYPFITSTLQQEAYKQLNFSLETTMRIAQQLYEKGYITYMRTDSPTLSKDITEKIKQYIIDKYGETYYRCRQYKSKSCVSQEAHEAIRPCNINIEYIMDMNDESNELYRMIWKRTISSQMTEEEIGTIRYKIKFSTFDKMIEQILIKNGVSKDVIDCMYFNGSINRTINVGYKIIYMEENDDNNIELLKNKLLHSNIKLETIIAKQNIQTISPLYNQCTLIKILDKYGIGRPSTYASIFKKIEENKYIQTVNIMGTKEKIEQIKMSFNKQIIIKEITQQIMNGTEKQKIIVTELGRQIILYMIQYYPAILNYKYTANLEEQLDLISDGKMNKNVVIKQFIENELN